MRPVEPIEIGARQPTGWKRVVYAKDQPEYIPLPSLQSQDRDSYVVSRWRLTWREWFAVLFGADVWLTLLTFRQPLQPIIVTIGRPDHVQDLVVEPTPSRVPGPPNPPQTKYRPVG